MANKYETKLDKLEKIKQQIKEEEKRIEQEIGKHVLKTFDLSYSDLEETKSLIDEIYTIYKEKLDQEESKENESKGSEYSTNNIGG